VLAELRLEQRPPEGVVAAPSEPARSLGRDRHPVEVCAVGPEQLDSGCGGQPTALERRERGESEHVERGVEREGPALMHHSHRSLAPFEPVAKAQSLDQVEGLPVLRKDMVVIKIWW
jgi:hypothetical protein